MRFAELGLDVASREQQTPEALAAFHKAKIEKWWPIIKSAGVRTMPEQLRRIMHPDIKPENTRELASRYLDVPNMPWEPTKFPGIRIKVLYSDDSGITTALFKLDPGAVVPLHEHTALEQTFVLEGTIEDHEGVCGPGEFVWRPAGNRHEAAAPNGAVILGFFLKPNRFAEGQKFFTANRSGA